MAWYEFSDILPILRPVCYDSKSDRFVVDLYLEHSRNDAMFTDSVLDDSLTVIR